MPSKHIVLAGDSIFDNDSYVMGEPGVIEQMRKSIPVSWSAFKIAVDGDCIRHVQAQIDNIPSNATDMVVSIGGNDARQYAHLIDKIKSPEHFLELLNGPIDAFLTEYKLMLDTLTKLNIRLHVCTIYTAIPFDDPLWRQYAPVAIGMFNNAIIEEAASLGVPVLKLDQLCTDNADFSAVSPIEPSAIGGQKIVDHIINALSSLNP